MTPEPDPTRIFVFDDLTPPVERATVADPFRVTPHGLAPRVPGADYVLADTLENADVAALPVHWDVYGRAFRQEALTSVAAARDRGLATVIWVNGDHEADIGVPGVMQFQLAARRNRPGRLSAVRCYPTFIDDHLPAGSAVAAADIGERPSIGFCGQGDERPPAAVATIARKVAHRVDHARRRRIHHPEPLASHIRLRRRALRTLADSDLVDTDFVIHDRYRAGIVDQVARRDPREPTNRAFRSNITANDYTLCVRGGGNFSTRLYETMALGRIPIIVDTHGVIPWEGVLPWDELAVIVPADDLDRLPEAVADRHRLLGPDGVRDLQRRCRQTWLGWLSLEGFFSRFGAALSPIG